MKNILITGGAGFIGSSLAERLADGTNRIVLVDNLLTGSMENVPKHPDIHFIKCDANLHHEMSSIMCSNKFDYVFHYAAVVGVKRTLESPIMVLDDLQGIRNVLMLSKNTGVKRVFFSSSSEVYGEPVELPQHEETTPLNSRLPYAIVKNVGEAFCRSFEKEYKLPYTILRFFNTYGPRQSEDFVITKFIRNALQGEPLTVNGDGKQTRTFCYIDDNVDCTKQIVEKDMFINDVINIGSEVTTTVLELAQTIIRLTGSSSKIEFLPPLKEGDMSRRLPDITRMRSVLRRDVTPLETGIRLVLNSKEWKK
jgi:UDP-glucose 4-epimerase